MNRNFYIIVSVLCLLSSTGKAQSYFSNRYDNFNNGDNNTGISYFEHQYLTYGCTANTNSLYSLNLGINGLTGTRTISRTYNYFSNLFVPHSGKPILHFNQQFTIAGTRFYKTDTSWVFLWRFDANLDSVKYKEYGYLNKINQVFAVTQGAGNAIYMAGSVDSLYKNADILLIKTDTLGNEIWKKRIGISGVDETALSIDTFNGKLIIGAIKTFHNANSYQGYTLYLDTAGTIIWNRPTSNNYGGGSMAKRLSDGNIVVCSPQKAYVQGSETYSTLKIEKVTPTNITIQQLCRHTDLRVK